MTFEGAPDVLSVLEAAKLLQIDRKSIYTLIHEGRLRAIRVGRKFIVPKLALQRLLDIVP